MAGVVELVTQDENGVALRDRLAPDDERLNAPELPEAGEFVWQWFWEIDAARSNNGYTFQPLSFREIEAWARLTGITLIPDEVRILRAMDRARLDAGMRPAVTDEQQSTGKKSLIKQLASLKAGRAKR